MNLAAASFIKFTALLFAAPSETFQIAISEALLLALFTVTFQTTYTSVALLPAVFSVTFQITSTLVANLSTVSSIAC